MITLGPPLTLLPLQFFTVKAHLSNVYVGLLAYFVFILQYCGHCYTVVSNLVIFGWIQLSVTVCNLTWRKQHKQCNFRLPSIVFNYILLDFNIVCYPYC
ncbi:hypothetical protein UPYG_G00217490 [Umbra pygmaea]|uniref:Uncharacterized protein n=1 Tax=Umbra pygmaea TaxID=75934 RepID=A0ABD0WL35_UMBPY